MSIKKSPTQQQEPVVALVYDTPNLTLCDKIKEQVKSFFSLKDQNFRLCPTEEGKSPELCTKIVRQTDPATLVLYLKTPAGMTQKYAETVRSLTPGKTVHQYGLQLSGNTSSCNVRNETSLTKLLMHAKNIFKHLQHVN